MSIKRTAEGNALSAIIIAVFRAHGALQEWGDRLAKPVGQTTSRWQVLGCIDNEALSVPEIARKMGLTRQSVQRTADHLVEDGLAYFEDNPKHMRSRLLAITENGLLALRTIESAQVTRVNDLGKNFACVRLKLARDVLREIISRIELQS